MRPYIGALFYLLNALSLFKPIDKTAKTQDGMEDVEQELERLEKHNGEKGVY